MIGSKRSRTVWVSALALAMAGHAMALDARVVVRQAQQAGPYDPVTIELDGPTLDAEKGANPFSDYALDVTFSDGKERVTVPGYFAGCARAADRACPSGRLWRAHFVPRHGGNWHYQVAFRTGADLVGAGAAGTSVAGIDGVSGSFDVAAAPRNAVRARGLLHYTGERYYRWSGSRELFFKLGPDAPENFLADADFDRTPNFKNFRKTWAPHVRDFSSDAIAYTWEGGKGKGILGALRYLHDAGLNSVSMLLFNVGGDDRNVVPQIFKVPLDAYAAMSPEDQWAKGVYHDRYDLSKLAQWQKVLGYADELGLHLHFKLEETENDKFMDGGGLGRERRIYLREMVARFGHFLALSWNLGEENVQDTKDQIDEAAYLARLDGYGHPLVLHTHPGEKERYRPLLGTASALNGLSLQGLEANFADMRPDIVKWSNASAAAGRTWVLGYDEQGGAAGGAPVDDDYPADRLPQTKNEKNPTQEMFRRGAIWNALTAGSDGVEVYYGYATGCTDLNCEDHRTRAHLWAEGVHALEFFRTYVGEAALRMKADDDLTPNANDFVFAEPGRIYVIYTSMTGVTNPIGGAAPPPDSRRARIMLQTYGQAGRYQVRWFDARRGGALQSGSVTEIEGGTQAALGSPPPGGSGEWAILVKRIS